MKREFWGEEIGETLAPKQVEEPEKNNRSVGYNVLKCVHVSLNMWSLINTYFMEQSPS
jgi:hypothetical protein